MTVADTGSTSKQVYVPADVQREEGICIDDHVDVTIHDVSDVIDKASFTNRQTGGDKVTIPADVVRTLGLVAGEEYEFEFENAEQDDLPGGIADESLDDDGEAVDNALNDAESEPDEESAGLGELFSDDESDESDDGQEEEGLGELFG